MTKEAPLNSKLRAFCQRLSKLLPDASVILHGSASLGENMPWSDVDLMVIADFKEPFFERQSHLALLNDTGLPLEIIAYTPGEFETMLDKLNAAAIESIETGIAVIPGPHLIRMKKRLHELKKLGLERTRCSYRLKGA
jgi:hypothetical protein